MTRGQKIVVIGHEDAVFGLELLGLSGRAVSTAEQARQAIREAAQDPETSLILLTEDLAEAQPAPADETSPLVVEIPSPRGASRSSAFERRIERALGVPLED